MLKNSYVLSIAADLDIEEIFDYTYYEFRLDQAIKYLTELDELFLKLTKNPEIGGTRDEIKKGLYSLPIGKHIVFYRIATDHIRVVRVLHGSRDLPRNFINDLE